MKQRNKIFSILLALCMSMSFFSGCETTYMNDDTSGDVTGETEGQDTPSEPDDPDPSEPSEPSTPSKPDTSEGSGESKEPEDSEGPQEGTDPSDPEDPEEPKPEDPIDPQPPTENPEKQNYAYLPQIFKVIPKISINTTDRSNDFITRPTRQDKLNGNIDYVSATISVDGPAEDLTNLPAQVKARGNYTLDYEKKPIRIKFDSKQSLLGLNEGQKYKSWVLLADYKDLSMLNNATAFYLGQTILGSDGFYCSDFCTVEVTVNGEYWGVYLLAEQQEAKAGRASATEADKGETGIDVGYLMEFDGYYMDEAAIPNGGGDPTFTIDYGGNLNKADGSSYFPWQSGYTVKSDLQSDEQLSFLKSYVENAFAILKAAAYHKTALQFNDTYTGTEPASCSPQEAVEKVIDLQSLADTYLLQEIACDPDIAWSSFYLSLDMRENGKQKLVFEAPWDYDSAFGIKWNTVNGAYGMYAANCENPWFSVLIRESYFQDLVREKWEKLIKYGVIKTSLSLIREQTTAYSDAYVNNLLRWPGRLYGNDELTYEMNQIQTQQGAADHLYQWLYARYNYLNTVFGDGKDVLTDQTPTEPFSPAPSMKAYRFEAEDCAFDAPMHWDNFYGGASGNAFLGDVQGDGKYRLITLTVNVAIEADAYLSVGLSKRAFTADFSDWFALFLNGEKLWLPPRPIEACKQNEEEWGAWTKIDLTKLHLKAGKNTIVLNMPTANATNLDYFELYCDSPITAQ